MAALQAFTDAYNHVNELGSETRRLRMEYDHPLLTFTIPKALKRSSSDAKLKPESAPHRPSPAVPGKFWQKPAEYKAVGAKRQMTVPGAYPDLDVDEPLYDHGISSPFIPGLIKRFLPHFFAPSPTGTPTTSTFPKSARALSRTEPRPVGYSTQSSFTTFTRSGVGRSATSRAISSPSTVCGGIAKKIVPSRSTLASRLNSSKVPTVARRGDDLDPVVSPLKHKSRRDRTGRDACYLDRALQLQHKKQLEDELAPGQAPNMAPQGKWSLGSRNKPSGKENDVDELAGDMASDERSQRFADVRSRIARLKKTSSRPRVPSDKSSDKDNTEQLVTPPPEAQSKPDTHATTDGSKKTTLSEKVVNTPKKGILRKPSSSDSDQSDELARDPGLPRMAATIYGYVQGRADLTPSPTESTGSLDEFAQGLSGFAISPSKQQDLDRVKREAREKEETVRHLKEEEDRKQREEEENARRLREEEARKQREEEFKKNAILKPLPEEWTDKVNSTIAQLEKDPGYKLPGTHVGLADMQKLLSGRYGGAGWLNDEVVNLYLNKVTTQILDKEAWNKQAPKPVHSFGSQFWTSFAAGGHRAVASWTRRQKIQGTHFLSCRAAVIPICNGVHWTALVLSGTDRTIAYYDSMGGTGSTYVARAREWLAGELGDKYLPSEWRVLETTPQYQVNSSDCGVFTCLNGHAALAGKVPIDAFRGGDVEATGRHHVAAVLAGMPAVI